MPTLNWSTILARRLVRHGLSTRVPLDQLAAQVGVMCGAHAQVIAAAELSIGLRVDGASRAAIQNALWTEHSLIKTHGPRGTVHLLPAADLPLWIGALSALPEPRRGWPAGVMPNAEQVEVLVAALDEALTSAELTVDEITAALVKRLGAWAGERVMPAFQDLWPRWRTVMETATRRGVVVFGPNRGRNTTYTSPRRFLPGFEPMPAEQALAGVVWRYLHAYGPAAPEHLAQWLNATPRMVSELFEHLGDALRSVTVNGVTLWANAGDTEPGDERPRGVRLLPYFDAYTVGSHPREWMFPGAAKGRIIAHGQAGNFPVLLVDGVAAGVWHARKAGKKVHLTVEALVALSKKQRGELEEQAERVGFLMEAKPEIRLGPVAVGPHA
jgi:hypothetical protein